MYDSKRPRPENFLEMRAGDATPAQVSYASSKGDSMSIKKIALRYPCQPKCRHTRPWGLSIFHCALIFALLIPITSYAQTPPMNRISHYGQPVFVAGANLAFFIFEADLGPSYLGQTQFTIQPNNGDSVKQKFIDALDDIEAAGGNTARWWLHTGANYTPQFDPSTGLVTGISPETLSDLKMALDLAADRNMLLVPTLFSFQLVEAAETYFDPSLPIQPKTATGGRELLMNEVNLQAYIDNALVPMVQSIGNHPALLAWDLFNEPEGATQLGFIPVQEERLPAVLLSGSGEELYELDFENFSWNPVDSQGNSIAGATIPIFGSTEPKPNPLYYIQRYASRAAKAIHDSVPGVQVTITSHYLDRISDKNQALNLFNQNYYTDAALASAGGETGPDPTGVLDFLMANFYAVSFPKSASPFHNSAGSYGTNKPIVVGEFKAGNIDPFIGAPPTFEGGDTVMPGSLFPTLHGTGYAGGMMWDHTGSWPATIQQVLCQSPEKASGPDASGACFAAPATMAMANALAAVRHLEDVAIVFFEAEDATLVNMQASCSSGPCDEPNTSGGAYVRMWPKQQRWMRADFEVADFPLGLTELVPMEGSSKLLEFKIRIRYRSPQGVRKKLRFNVDGGFHLWRNVDFGATGDEWAVLEEVQVLPVVSTFDVVIRNPNQTSGLKAQQNKLDIDRISVTRVPATP
ncbi:MAG: hypothetical protein AAF560_25490 [Acidobacteriota bacterium]